MNDLLYKIGITLIEGVGDVNAKALVSYCGNPEAVFKEKKSGLLKIPGIGSITANSIINQKVLSRAEEEIKFILKHKIAALFFTDKDYPHRLKHCADSPVILYYKGAANLNEAKILSIVGTRKATPYGKNICDKLMEGLASLNVLVVSGLAYGIDICAHKAALENNLQTIGVLAHGLDRIYPTTHRATAEKMVRNGGLLTDFVSRTNPDKENFPKRNRIVAGLADATVVIESGKEGGSLITADIANSYSRDVFAFPGRVDDVCSEGCNFFIRTNRAALVRSAEDIIYSMGWEEKKKKQEVKSQKKLFVELSPEEKLIVDYLQKKEQANIDGISYNTKLTPGKLAALLLTLEFSGIVTSLPGKVYQLG